MNAAIVDGYIDEPSMLGVPPYLCPYSRYAAGILGEATYFTIDQIRAKPNLLRNFGVIVFIGGTTVPGKYVGGVPATLSELEGFARQWPDAVTVLGGPEAKLAKSDAFDLVCRGDLEACLEQLVEARFNVDKVDPKAKLEGPINPRWAARGAAIAGQHPNFELGYLLAEIETYRGCARYITGGCSFCSEPLKGKPKFREVKDVVEEVKLLYRIGVRAFRIGAQPDLFAYWAKGVGEKQFPQPVPEQIERLYKGIRNVAPELRVLHLDNVNPGTIVHWPKESLKIAKTIVRYNTPGDVAAFGVESVDPVVIKKNNLKCSGEEALEAIGLLNKVGSARNGDSLPKLLPGLNFIAGLPGQTKATFNLNFAFLEEVLKRKLLVRRINLRQLLQVRVKSKAVNKHHSRFLSFKKKVREKIDRPMLRLVAPRGTLLKNVFAEFHDGDVTFGRQLGSYPLLVGVPMVLPLGHWRSLRVIDYGFRSVTGLPKVKVNEISLKLLQEIPGVGAKRAATIVRKRPFKSKDKLLEVVEDKDVLKFIEV